MPLGHCPLPQTLGAKPLLLHIQMPQEHGQPGLSQSIVSQSLPTYYPPPPHLSLSLSPTPSPSSFFLSPSTSSSLPPQEMKSCYVLPERSLRYVCFYSGDKGGSHKTRTGGSALFSSRSLSRCPVLLFLNSTLVPVRGLCLVSQYLLPRSQAKSATKEFGSGDMARM